MMLETLFPFAYFCVSVLWFYHCGQCPQQVRRWGPGTECRYRRQVMGGSQCDCCVNVGSWNFEQGNQDVQKEESIFTELQ